MCSIHSPFPCDFLKLEICHVFCIFQYSLTLTHKSSYLFFWRSSKTYNIHTNIFQRTYNIHRGLAEIDSVHGWSISIQHLYCVLCSFIWIIAKPVDIDWLATVAMPNACHMLSVNEKFCIPCSLQFESNLISESENSILHASCIWHVRCFVFVVVFRVRHRKNVTNGLFN